METGLVFLAYVVPMVLGMQVGSDDMQRITEAQAVIIEQQMIAEEEQRREEQYQLDLNETMTEGFISRLESLDGIHYRLGRFDIESNKFDCVGLFKAYAMMRGLLDYDEAKYINSYVMSHIGDKKDLRDAKRGDVTYRHPLGDDYRHIAMVTKEYDPAEGGLRIIDNLGSKPKHRFIRLHNGVYLGRRKVTVHSSPFVELANKKGLKYEPLRSYEGMFNLSRYYSVMPDQERYYLGQTYEQDFAMNCHGDCLTTAGGVKLTDELVEKVVACPKKYKIGTKFRIEDWIEVTCVDRGGSIQNKRLDIRAGIGIQGLENIEQNKVVTGRRNIYKYNLYSKPINETNTLFVVLNNRGDTKYITLPDTKENIGTSLY